jgi:2-hydroxychromene-2-carboxylate isomerase
VRNLDFYFFYGSIYSYLSVVRIGALASAAHAEVRWRPFNIDRTEQHRIQEERGEDELFLARGRKARRRHKIPFTGRAPYPVDPELLALRVGVIAAEDGWCADYSRTTFHEWFIGQRAPGVAAHVERTLASLGKSPAPIIARAKSADGERLLKEATDGARKLGIFGAPTFAIGSEIYWGGDRLADALSFASGR